MKLSQVKEILDTKFTGKAIEKDYCKYLTSDDKKCFIGLFIPDGHDGQYFDGSVAGLLYEYPDLEEYMPSQDIEALEDLQTFHDKLDDRLSVKEQRELIFNYYKKHVDAFC